MVDVSIIGWVGVAVFCLVGAVNCWLVTVLFKNRLILYHYRELEARDMSEFIAKRTADLMLAGHENSVVDVGMVERQDEELVRVEELSVDPLPVDGE